MIDDYLIEMRKQEAVRLKTLNRLISKYTPIHIINIVNIMHKYRFCENGSETSLKDIEEYIRNFIMVNPIPHYNYKEKALEYKDSLALKTKVQDALIVLHKIEAPMEVVLLMKAKLKKIEQEEKRQREL